ncbi:hypothetical protein H7U19_05565 [Hyunsoonleella sp. SJ7]|uniref:Lipoprotein n=1 Tax=Hyunsoonleella aquatilis TaxID=2762758 RepID=A0A923H879_9FLAO|nr:hypothetical protein [Hyunsoonleella aquatilis]MBC3757863.1 hypothetical protein [Hyunsoonleella aquatilis]
MKKIILFLIAGLTIVVTSCQFSEHIYFNEDGSGRMEFVFDASEIMQMAGEDKNDNAGEKDMDSTFTFKEIFEEKKDSIATLPIEEQERLKSLENFKVHMLVNEAEKVMNVDISTEFKNADELQEMFTALNALENLKGKDSTKVNEPANPFTSMANGGNTDVSYSFNNGVFKRNVKVIDKEVQQQMKDSLGEAAMMFANSKYKVNYHFPRRVKSVSNDKALFSADGKTVIVEYGLIDYMTNPEVMNLEIVLED